MIITNKWLKANQIFQKMYSEDYMDENNFFRLMQDVVNKESIDVVDGLLRKGDSYLIYVAIQIMKVTGENESQKDLFTALTKLFACQKSYDSAVNAKNAEVDYGEDKDQLKIACVNEEEAEIKLIAARENIFAAIEVYKNREVKSV